MPGGSEGVVAFLARANAEDLVDGRHEELAVADLPRLRRGPEGHDYVVEYRVLDDDLDHDLRHEVDDIGRAPIDLGLAPRASEALHLVDRHSGDSGFAKTVAHLLELVRSDDRFDLFHQNAFAPTGALEPSGLPPPVPLTDMIPPSSSG